MANLLSVISGLLFGLGLALSGMLSPGKVVGFLDLTGNWDPSLAFVMGGGVAVTLLTFHLLLKREKPPAGDHYHLPTATDIDQRLLVGAGLFGIGWALGGLCPGPAISSLAYANPKIVVFGLAMVVGMAIARRVFPASGS